MRTSRTVPVDEFISVEQLAACLDFLDRLGETQATAGETLS